MKATSIIFILLLLNCSCGPDNKEVTTKQVETGNREEALDSIANTEEDGVNTVEDDTTDKQLP